DGTGDGVGRRDGLTAARPQAGAEGAAAVAQRAVGRQRRHTVAAGEVDRAAVTGRRVVELVQRRDREVERGARRGRGRGADGEVGGSGGAYVYAALFGADGTGDGVGRRDGLTAGGLESGAEGAGATAQGGVARQRRLT